MSQNIVEFGLDVSSFNQQKAQVLNQFIELFNKLEKYDGKTISPIKLDGIASLDSSLKSTSKTLDEINSKMTALTQSLNSNAAAQSKANSATQSQKKDVDEIAKLKKKLSELDSQSAKDAMALKVQIAERVKLQKEEAQNANQMFQSRKQQAAEEKKAAQEKRAQEAELRKEQKKNEAERIKAEQEYEKETERTANAQMAREGQNAKTLSELKERLKNQQEEYSKMALDPNASATQARAMLSVVRETQQEIDSLNSKMRDTNSSAGRIGKSLNEGFQIVRTAAYILPGLGIAGIFSLIGEGIAKVSEGLGLFSSEVKKSNAFLDAQITYSNNAIKSISELNKMYRDVKAISSVGSGETERRFAVLDAGGLEAVQSNENKLILLRQKYTSVVEESKRALKAEPTQDRFNAELKDRLVQIAAYKSEIMKIDAYLKGYASYKYTGKQGDIPKGMAYLNLLSMEQIEAERKLLERQLEERQGYYNEVKMLADDFVKYGNQIKIQEAENRKFIADETRKLEAQKEKDIIADRQEALKVRYKDEITGEKEKEKIIREMRMNDARIALIDYNSVMSNNSSTIFDKESAASEYKKTIALLDISQAKELQELATQYEERRIDALLEAKKSEVETNAEYDKKMSMNVYLSLQERLDFYEKYIQEKKRKEDIEDERLLSKRKFKNKDDATVELERAQIKAASDFQKAGIDASQPGDIFEIYSTYASSVMKELDNSIALLRNNGKEELAFQLENVSEKYSKQLISLRQFNEERIKIQKEYEKKDLQEQLRGAVLGLEELERKKAEVSAPALFFAEKELQDAVIFGSQLEIDKARSKYEALDNMDGEFAKKIKFQQETISALKVKIAMTDAERQEAIKKEELRKFISWVTAARQVEAALYSTIRDIKNAEFEEDKRLLSEKKKIVDEQYGYEMNAIRSSSLSSKDKTALEIQLNAQKLQSDREYAMQQKKIAREQAQFNKELAIAHIIFDTASAVVSLLETPPLAIAAGIIGAINLAKAVSVKIPSYRTGTENHQGGLARFGEDGAEIVHEPGKKPYIALEETIKELPRGTKVIPMSDIGVSSIGINYAISDSSSKQDEGWEKTIWLAKQLKQKPKKTVTNNIVIVNLGHSNYKRSKLYGE